MSNAISSYSHNNIIPKTLSPSSRAERMLSHLMPTHTAPLPQSLSQVPSSSSVEAIYLDWTQRPKELQQRINSAFNYICKDESSKWGLYNGSEEYAMCGVKEHDLMKKIILDAYPARKEFYVLDIGAGNFQWNESLASYIEKQTDLPPDITVHIIGIRGEKNTGTQKLETSRCRIYQLGAFKVEEMETEFAKIGLDLKNKIDMATSRWCLRHLADPGGTFLQTMNLLRPQTGHFLFDGFMLCYDNEELGKKFNPRTNMVQLLSDLKTPFLRLDCSSANKGVDHFLVKRTTEAPCQLPMVYKNCLNVSSLYERSFDGSSTMTQFHRTAPSASRFTWMSIIDETLHSEKLLGGCNRMSGEKSLHEWLKRNRLLNNPDQSWFALTKADLHKEFPPLHTAILRGDKTAIQKHIENGSDLNESDANGRTPLHLSILQKNRELFQFLLTKVDIKLYDLEGHPLHIAVRADQEGEYVQALIEAGADVNAEGSSRICRFTPLDLAIEAANFKAIEILMKAGADCSKENIEALKKMRFSTDQALLPKSRL